LIKDVDEIMNRFSFGKLKKKGKSMLCVIISLSMLLLCADFVGCKVENPTIPVDTLPVAEETTKETTEESTEAATKATAKTKETTTKSTTTSETTVVETTKKEKEKTPVEPIEECPIESDIPVFCINGPVEELLTEEKGYTIEGSYALFGTEGSGEYYDGNLEMKTRGHSSFFYDKKSFKIKLDKKQDFFDMGKSKHWVLLANWTEGSFMRNHLAYQLSEEFGLLAMHGTWVNLVVNGEEFGNYYLCEQIRVEGGRVDIEILEDTVEKIAAAFVTINEKTDYAWIPEDNLVKMMMIQLEWIDTDEFTYADVTFKVSDYYNYDREKLINTGYLVEIDSALDTDARFETSLGRPILIHDPEHAEVVPDIITYLEDIFNAFESGLIDKTYTATYKGETVSIYDLMDMDSLIAYFWIQEIFLNADGWYRSTYLYKDADLEDGSLSKFYIGPVWDMDYSSGGMRDSGESYATNVWGFKDFVPIKQPATAWHKYLIKDPEFQEKAYDFYVAHHDEILAMIDSIDEYETYLQDSITRDAAVWGVWRNDFNTEVQTLKEWLIARVAWLDQQTETLEKFKLSVQ